MAQYCIHPVLQGSVWAFAFHFVTYKSLCAFGPLALAIWLVANG